MDGSSTNTNLLKLKVLVSLCPVPQATKMSEGERTMLMEGEQ